MGLSEIEANFPFLPLARTGLLVACCSGRPPPLGSGEGACGWACLVPLLVAFFRVVDFVILFTVTVVLSFATVMWRLELRLWWAAEEEVTGA